jgi:hypothetical protein
MVPDVLSFGNCHEMKLHRQGIYKAAGMLIERIIPQRFIFAPLIHCSLDEVIESLCLIWDEERLQILVASNIKMLSNVTWAVLNCDFCFLGMIFYLPLSCAGIFQSSKLYNITFLHMKIFT